MSSKNLMVVTLVICALKFISTQTSCRGRCGAEYYRGNLCHCDYTCLSFEECCRDYESQCTTKNSCKGRCGEVFKRGRLCSCDSECSKFRQCCPDYKDHCDVDAITAEISGAATGPMKSSSCDNVHNNPKESTLTEDPSFGEGNNADDNLFTPDSSTPYPPTDLSDDILGEIFPGDDFSPNGVVDPETSPGPEISSDDGKTSAVPLDKIPTEATLVRDDPEFSTEGALSLTEQTPVDDIFTPKTTVSTDQTRDPGQKTTPSEPTAAQDYNISDPSSSSAPPIEPTASSGDTETELEISPSDKPEVRPTNMQDLVGDLENPQLSTTPASSTLASVIPTEETISVSDIESSPGSVVTSSPDVVQSIKDPVSILTPDGDGFPSSTAASPTIVITSSPDVVQNIKDPISILTPDGDGFPSSTAASPDNTNDSVKPDVTAADPPTSEPDPKPDPSKASPMSKPETKPLDPQTQITDNPRDYQGDDSDDTNLCSGRPVSGATTLRNGTMVVFRGHYFWFLDRNLVPSPPKGITEVWGVPSPIDTVFTRCNCQGKTYIFKGGKYWRFENDALDPGYPKIIKTGFDGLQGHITAALSVPQYLSRKESVYFFKRGGTVQKYSYQFGTSSTCGRTAQVPVYTVRARMVRQAVSVLEPAINIRKAWRGFPSTITAAVSVPSNRDPEGYKYIVFSRSTAYNVRIHAERPVITAPRANVSPKTDNFFRCPKKS